MGIRPAGSVILLLFCVGLVGPPNARADGTPPPPSCRLQFNIQDQAGNPLSARVRVQCSDGRTRPDSLDHARLTYIGGGGFFYADGSTWLNVPTGATRVTIGKGFEWNAWDRTVQVVRDTTVQVILTRFVDFGASGWYGGEMHAHTRHDPINYPLLPEQVKMIAKAEGLSVIHLLDERYQFTGGPHALSDGETILYYTAEYRNGAYGHVELPALNDSIPAGCCNLPYPAYPMLMDLRRNVVPANAPMMILAHPHNTDDYWGDHNWPGSGLARELPVLAALGALDALDVVSYNNIPNFQDWDDWFAVLSAGLPCPPSAGTDCLMCSRTSMPVAGWRVYANIGAGQPLDYNQWVEALRTGRTFVTSYPLIEDFHVGSAGMGETIENPDSMLQATVHLKALCAMGLRKISIIADGGTVWNADLFGHVPPLKAIDTTFALSIPTPPWLTARVEGIVANPHDATNQSIAMTSANRVTRNGVPIRRTTPSGRWMDSLDSLQTFVTIRGNWDTAWEHDSVFARIDRARAFYRRAFVLPPNDFQLSSPIDGDTVQSGHISLHWQPAVDPEGGDRISYDVYVARDSLFALPRHFKTDSTQISGLSLSLARWYWYVRAGDRALNGTRSTPSFASFVVTQGQSAVGDDATRLPLRAVGFPNPSNGTVRLVGFVEPIAIFDAAGRWVAGSGHGIRKSGEGLVWDGRIRGRSAPAGLYWVRGSGSGKPVRLIRVR